MAEYLLRDQFESEGLRVHSAGLGALVGEPAHAVAQELMAGKGIDITAHRARQLDDYMVDEADLILTMESRHKTAILARSPLAQGRIYRIGEIQGFDIADPYRGSRDDFVRSLTDIERGLADWTDRLRSLTA